MALLPAFLSSADAQFRITSAVTILGVGALAAANFIPASVVEPVKNTAVFQTVYYDWGIGPDSWTAVPWEVTNATQCDNPTYSTPGVTVDGYAPGQHGIYQGTLLTGPEIGGSVSATVDAEAATITLDKSGLEDFTAPASVVDVWVPAMDHYSVEDSQAREDFEAAGRPAQHTDDVVTVDVDTDFDCYTRASQIYVGVTLDGHESGKPFIYSGMLDLTGTGDGTPVKRGHPTPEELPA